MFSVYALVSPDLKSFVWVRICLNNASEQMIANIENKIGKSHYTFTDSIRSFCRAAMSNYGIPCEEDTGMRFLSVWLEEPNYEPSKEDWKKYIRQPYLRDMAEKDGDIDTISVHIDVQNPLGF